MQDFFDDKKEGFEEGEPIEDTPVEVEDSEVIGTEEEAEPIWIDLSGRAEPRTEEEGSGDAVPYTEYVKKRKKKHQGRRYLAAMLALTVLNLALFAGAFVLGTRYGSGGRSAASKQELVSTLRGEDENKTTETAHKGTQLETTEIAKKVGPAVVGITSVVQGQMSIFGGFSQSNGEGSGIILSQDGYIVTNNHVVENSTSVLVTLNTGSEYEAKVIGADEQTDLAVIKIEPKEELIVATLGDSTQLEVGERVVAIGNPMGLEFFGSVTQGIVSAVNRTISIDNRTMNLIQTDAAINSGNSGGALINAYGEVIGINSVKVSSSGIEGMSFAIPISEASPIISDLLEYGYVKGRPVIGIATRDVTAYMAQAYSWPVGAQIMSVSSESAREAGLQQGDIILSVNGEKISTGEELNKIKDQHKPGDTLKLEIYKYATGRTETIQVTLTEQIPG
ncbi:MAG: trypsin-like peptidase domain-containing protein [Clostridia bacterium]|nr:trypsin-like peptidase domain-containing protein [Clostridia bacterium]